MKGTDNSHCPSGRHAGPPATSWRDRAKHLFALERRRNKKPDAEIIPLAGEKKRLSRQPETSPENQIAFEPEGLKLTVSPFRGPLLRFRSRNRRTGFVFPLRRSIR